MEEKRKLAVLPQNTVAVATLPGGRIVITLSDEEKDRLVTQAMKETDGRTD